MSAIEKVLEFADDVLSLVENEGGELEGGVDTIALAKAELAQLRDRNGTLNTALQCASAANWDGIIWGRKSPFQNIINNLVGNPPYEGIVKPTETIAQVCAYCGVEASGRDEMMAHIQVCDKHPLAALRAELTQLRADNISNRKGWNDCYEVNCKLRSDNERLKNASPQMFFESLDKDTILFLRAELAAANRAVEELNKLSESYELELAGYRLALHRLQEMLTAHPEGEE